MLTGPTAQNETFMKAGMDFIEQTLVIAEVMRVVPQSLASRIAAFLQKKLNASQIIFKTLEPIAAQRIEERARAAQGHKVPEYVSDRRFPFHNCS